MPSNSVYLEGPEPDRDANGREIPAWFVYVGDDKAAPVGKVHTCRNFNAANSFARRLAQDRRLQLINHATTL